MGRPGFPDRDENGALFSYGVTDYAPPGPSPIMFPPVVPEILKLRDRLIEAVKRIELPQIIPTFPLPDPVEKVEDDDCPAIALALRQIVLSIERLTETTRAGHTAQAVVLAGIAEKLGHLDFLFNQKFPHRNFVVGAQIDLQHHIRDAADIIAARLAQVLEGATGVKCKEMGFPALTYTSPKLDRDVLYLGDRIAWDTKQHPQSGR